jgi:hypothetical protein
MNHNIYSYNKNNFLICFHIKRIHTHAAAQTTSDKILSIYNGILAISVMAIINLYKRDLQRSTKANSIPN